MAVRRKEQGSTVRVQEGRLFVAFGIDFGTKVYRLRPYSVRLPLGVPQIKPSPAAWPVAREDDAVGIGR